MDGAWVLPVVIFLAEAVVVTTSTIRVIFIARGKRGLAAILGFIEISIWLFAISHVMRNLDNPWCMLAFAAGFTLGNYLGVTLERRMALGKTGLRLFSRHNATPLITALRARGFGVTSWQAAGLEGSVEVIQTVIPRRDQQLAEALIHRHDPGMFYIVEEIYGTESGVFPSKRPQEEDAKNFQKSGYHTQDVAA
jgi:uncharacterized protein YebE (UPF0316 family)